MSFLGPSILKINGGLGQTAPSDRNVAGLIIANGYAVSSTFVLGSTYKFTSLDEAEALGLGPTTDANALVDTMALIWYHISEFFRLNPDGTLYVHNGNAVAPANIFAADGPADKIMTASGNAVRFMGVVFGVDPADVITQTGGFADFVATTRTAAQAWVTARAAAFVYVDCIALEGYKAAAALVDQKVADAPQCAVVAACDFGYMDSIDELNANLKYTAAIGTVLGSIGVRMLSESMGSVMLEKYPDHARGYANYSLVDTRRERWLQPGLSDGTRTFDSLSQAVRTDLTDKAYIYVGQYEGYEGVYLNGEATCTTVDDDYNTIHINRLWNEAARRVRRALVPRINSRVQIEPDSGKIKPSAVADWDAACKRELNTLLAETEIADFRFSMDPNQDVIAQGKVIVKVSITPNGIAKAIEAEIGFNNPALA